MTTCRTVQTLRICITGTVQGVGFRPFIYNEAAARDLRGWVRNTSSGVEIIASGDEDALRDFVDAIKTSAPAASRINCLKTTPAEEEPQKDGFHILESNEQGTKNVVITPDLATCHECLAEIHDSNNPRHRYPFTNCTSCGPRYSIMQQLPYDRERTTMRTFRMCPECRKEFDDPANRRFHAQPNACPVCGPQLALWDNKGHTLAAKDDALVQAVNHLKDGKILAVKGLGGFHLIADAANDRTVRLLRDRKHREEKPFAVMMPNIETAQQYARISDLEKDWITSSVAPIVLVKKLTGQRDPGPYPLLSESIAPGNPDMGIFLPYTPLHHLLLEEFGAPLIATSGNLSDEPICIDELEVRERLGGIADFYLVHNRPIAHPVDDSVIRIAAGRPLFIRCARGLAPLTIHLPGPGANDVVIGAGAHMKSTFAIGRGDQVIISPHIGDLETIPAWHSFEQNFETLKELYETEPRTVACDKHPDYASSRFASREFDSPLPVQHHVAHVLAVTAEHGLTEPVLGFAWDGTGYGDDGTIWGGEVLKVDANNYERVAHLRPFLLPGGDAAAREPRRSAFSILHELGMTGSLNLPFSNAEVSILQTVMTKEINTVKTTSIGRLFDAVASLLGICHVSSYEGQAAMMLQAKAEEIKHDGSFYKITDNLDWEPIINSVIANHKNGVNSSIIAARFHQSMVNMLIAVSNAHPELPVVLSGGCFQNTWLLENSVQKLQQLNRRVYWPNLLPPNDGAISFGQVIAANWRSIA